MSSIGDRIRQRRTELGMTQEELAHKVGYDSRYAICKIEKGTRQVQQTMIKKFADALNISIVSLMGWNHDDYTMGTVLANASNDPDCIYLIEHYLDLSKDNKLRLVHYAEGLTFEEKK